MAIFTQAEKENLEKIMEDMYFGKDSKNPPVTTRLDRIEQILSDLKQWKWILIAATITMIADIISNHFHNLKF